LFQSHYVKATMTQSLLFGKKYGCGWRPFESAKIFRCIDNSKLYVKAEVKELPESRRDRLKVQLFLLSSHFSPSCWLSTSDGGGAEGEISNLVVFGRTDVIVPSPRTKSGGAGVFLMGKMKAA